LAIPVLGLRLNLIATFHAGGVGGWISGSNENKANLSQFSLGFGSAWQ